MFADIITPIRTWSAVFITAFAVTATSCSSDSPTGPSQEPPPATTPNPNPTPPAPAVGAVQVSITPNPVPFSGQPITDAAGCVGSANTWFYDQTLTETGGALVTITARTDSFDDRVVNNLTNLSMAVPAKGTLVVKSRWCSATSVTHTAQTVFKGTDASGNAVTVNGPTVRLMGK